MGEEVAWEGCLVRGDRFVYLHTIPKLIDPEKG